MSKISEKTRLKMRLAHLGKKGKTEKWYKAMAKMRNENHYNWRNGIMHHTNGYILKKVSNHPYRNQAGYVFEHRLVIEKKLGRYLSPQERVHHLNGIKNDNRIENLILFSTVNEHSKFHYPQGSKFGIHSH